MISKLVLSESRYVGDLLLLSEQYYKQVKLATMAGLIALASDLLDTIFLNWLVATHSHVHHSHITTILQIISHHATPNHTTAHQHHYTTPHVQYTHHMYNIHTTICMHITIYTCTHATQYTYCTTRYRIVPHYTTLHQTTP